jgi:hypothetical protein
MSMSATVAAPWSLFMLEGGLEQVAATEKVVVAMVLLLEEHPLPLGVGFIGALLVEL